MFQGMSEVRAALRKAVIDHPSKFEWAAFSNGIFMNYLGQGCPEATAKNGLSEDYIMCYDVSNMKAQIPLTKEGKVPTLIMTELADIGSMVSDACEEPFGQWNESLGIVGDKRNMDEIVGIIEKARGGKMQVEYLPYETIAKMAEEETSPLSRMWFQLMLSLARNEYGDSLFNGTVNELGKTSPISIEGYLTKFWSPISS